MTIEKISRSFSKLPLEDILSYAFQSQKVCGIILVVIDHMNDQQSHISQLREQLQPFLRKMIRPTDLWIQFSQDTWIVCLEDCHERLLKSSQYSIQSILYRLNTQRTDNLSQALIAVRGVLLEPQSPQGVIKIVEEELQGARKALRQSKMIRSMALEKTDNTNCSHVPYEQSMIHEATLENRLFLAFQPIIATDTGQIHHYECLVRMMSKTGEVANTANFLEGCERTGLIQLIDQKVQQLAIAELLNDASLNLSINVSAVTANNPVWLNTLKAQITARSCLKGRLSIELTETSVFQNMDESIQFIRELRNLGCSVSIDDFGAGYMSFMLLKSDLIESVKIDAQLIKTLSQNPKDIHCVRALIALAHAQGIHCTAEGVEDAKTAQFLKDEQVDYLQGYYFGKPSSLREWI